MSTRGQLEEILAAQRARMLRTHPPPRGKRGRDLVGALAVIAILIASGAAMFFAIKMTTPKMDPTATASASPLPGTPASTPTIIMATPIAIMVCTDIPDGRLHVRFAAGDGSEVRGYLAEGEAVQVALALDGSLDSQTVKNNLWVRITSPVAGWVNARYLCKQE